MAERVSISNIVDLVGRFARAVNRGDETVLAEVFHPDAQIIGRFDGQMEWSGLTEFIAVCRENAQEPDSPLPPHEVHGIELAGDTAVARVAIQWGGLHFFDTLSMVYDGRRWRIVARVFAHLA